MQREWKFKRFYCPHLTFAFWSTFRDGTFSQLAVLTVIYRKKTITLTIHFFFFLSISVRRMVSDEIPPTTNVLPIYPIIHNTFEFPVISESSFIWLKYSVLSIPRVSSIMASIIPITVIKMI